MAKNCWKNCTPMETGLVLALIVAVTFLIIMILVYLVGESSITAILGPAYYECKRACHCIDDFSRLLFFPLNPDSHIMDEPEVFNLLPFGQSELYETVCLGKNYSMAAVLKQTYDDDPNYFEYISPAAVLSPDWLISQNTSDYNGTDIFAAIGSKYWSQSGYLHRVETIIPIGEFLVLLKLQMKIIIGINWIDLAGTLEVMENVLVTQWDGEYKHEKAIEMNLSLVESSFCRDGMFCTGSSENGLELESALAIWNNHLYGFYRDTVCDGIMCLHRFAAISPYISDITLYLKKNIL